MSFSNDPFKKIEAEMKRLREMSSQSMPDQFEKIEAEMKRLREMSRRYELIKNVMDRASKFKPEDILREIERQIEDVNNLTKSNQLANITGREQAEEALGDFIFYDRPDEVFPYSILLQKPDGVFLAITIYNLNDVVLQKGAKCSLDGFDFEINNVISEDVCIVKPIE